MAMSDIEKSNLKMAIARKTIRRELKRTMPVPGYDPRASINRFFREYWEIVNLRVGKNFLKRLMVYWRNYVIQVLGTLNPDQFRWWYGEWNESRITLRLFDARRHHLFFNSRRRSLGLNPFQAYRLWRRVNLLALSLIFIYRGLKKLRLQGARFLPYLGLFSVSYLDGMTSQLRYVLDVNNVALSRLDRNLSFWIDLIGNLAVTSTIPLGNAGWLSGASSFKLFTAISVFCELFHNLSLNFLRRGIPMTYNLGVHDPSLGKVSRKNLLKSCGIILEDNAGPALSRYVNLYISNALRAVYTDMELHLKMGFLNNHYWFIYNVCSPILEVVSRDLESAMSLYGTGDKWGPRDLHRLLEDYLTGYAFVLVITIVFFILQAAYALIRRRYWGQSYVTEMILSPMTWFLILKRVVLMTLHASTFWSDLIITFWWPGYVRRWNVMTAMASGMSLLIVRMVGLGYLNYEWVECLLIAGIRRILLGRMMRDELRLNRLGYEGLRLKFDRFTAVILSLKALVDISLNLYLGQFMIASTGSLADFPTF